MKAIMINSKLRTVYYCHLSEKQKVRMAEMYDRLECRLFELGHYFDNGDALFVDEEGMLTMDNESIFFSINGQQPFVGNGLIIGKEIELKDDSYTIEDIETKIESLNINFLTFETLKEMFLESRS